MPRRAVAFTAVECFLVFLAIMFATNRSGAGHPGGLVCYFLAAAAVIFYITWREKEKADAQECAELHIRTIEALALAIEAVQHSPDDHLQRVRVYALKLGQWMKMPPGQLAALRTAALLHNIGKLAVPAQISSRIGPLKPEESAKIKVHTLVGEAILESVRFPFPVAPIVRSQHERWDGRGVPDGLKGEEIPVGARVLAVAESLASLVSTHQGENMLPVENAVKALTQESGQAFDPQMIALLAKRCHELDEWTCPEITAQLGDSVADVQKSHDAGKERTVQDSGADHPLSFRSSISRARREAETVFELSSDLGSSLDLEETLSALAGRLKRLVPFSSIVAYVERDETLVPEYVGGENFRLLASLRIPLGEGLSGWVAANRRPVVNGDPALESGDADNWHPESAPRSAISIPLEGQRGIVGALTLYSGEARAYTDDHLRILQTISPKVALSVENALAFQRAENSATTDYLTGLPNARALFLHLDRELARCRRLNASACVMVCDLDGFKQINDLFGHLEGNRILKIFARGLQDSCRKYDFVARMGGDEFVIVAPGLSAEAATGRAIHLDRLARAAGKEIGRNALLSLSVGYAICPEDGIDTEKLLAEADRRMYLEKQRHKGDVLNAADPDQSTTATR